MKKETKAIHDAWKAYKKWAKTNRPRFIEDAELRTLGEFKTM